MIQLKKGMCLYRKYKYDLERVYVKRIQSSIAFLTDGNKVKVHQDSEQVIIPVKGEPKEGDTKIPENSYYSVANEELNRRYTRQGMLKLISQVNWDRLSNKGMSDVLHIVEEDLQGKEF